MLPRQGTDFSLVIRKPGRRANEQLAWYVAADGGVLMSMSPLWCQWLECDECDLTGHGWTRFVHQDDQDITREALNRLQAHQSLAPFTQRWVARSGRVLTLRISAWIWVSPHGYVRRVVGGARWIDSHAAVREHGQQASFFGASEKLRTRATHSAPRRNLRRTQSQVHDPTQYHHADSETQQPQLTF